MELAVTDLKKKIKNYSTAFEKLLLKRECFLCLKSTANKPILYQV